MLNCIDEIVWPVVYLSGAMMMHLFCMCICLCLCIQKWSNKKGNKNGHTNIVPTLSYAQFHNNFLKK